MHRGIGKYERFSRIRLCLTKCRGGGGPGICENRRKNDDGMRLGKLLFLEPFDNIEGTTNVVWENFGVEPIICGLP